MEQELVILFKDTTLDNYPKFVSLIHQGVGNGNDNSSAGFLYLYDPSNTTFVKHFMIESNRLSSGGFCVRTFIGGYFNTTSAIDAVQFKMSSGNMDAGTIKLYGIKDS